MHVYKKIGFHGHTDNIAHDRDRVKRNSPSYAWQTLTDYFLTESPKSHGDMEHMSEILTIQHLLQVRAIPPNTQRDQPLTLL